MRQAWHVGRALLGGKLEARGTTLKAHASRVGEQRPQCVGGRVDVPVDVNAFVTRHAFPWGGRRRVQLAFHREGRPGEQVAVVFRDGHLWTQLHGLVCAELGGAHTDVPLVFAPIHRKNAAEVHPLSKLTHREQRGPLVREIVWRQGHVVQSHARHESVVGVPPQRRQPEHLGLVGVFQAGQHAQLKGLHALEQARGLADVVASVVVQRDAVFIQDPPVHARHDRCVHGSSGAWRGEGHVHHTQDGVALHGRDFRRRRQVADVFHRQALVLGCLHQSQVVALCGLDPIAKEPTEVFARGFLQAKLKVFRGRVTEFPLVEVELHRLVERHLAQVRLQHRERRRGLLVNDGAVVQRREAVAVALDGLIRTKPRREQVAQFVDPLVLEVFQLKALGQVVLAPKQQGNVFVFTVLGQEVPGLVERVDALVHPRVFTLVASKDAVEPVVADFMDDDRLQPRVAASGADDRHVGVFHAATCRDGAIHGRDLVVRVVSVPERVAIRRIVEVFRGLLPKLAFFWGEHGPRGDLSLVPWQDDGAAQDFVALVRKPREIVHVVLAVVQRFGALGRCREGVVSVYPALVLDPHLGVGRQAVQARLLGVVVLGTRHQVACGAHRVVGGQGNFHVIAAVLGKEFALAEVGHGVPALLVVDRGLGEPLGDLIRLSNMSQARNAAAGDVDPEGGFEDHAAAGGQGLVQLHLGDVDVLRVETPSQRPLGAGERQGIDASQVPAHRVEHEHVSVAVVLPGHRRLAISVGVGPKVDPHMLQGFRAVVLVGDAHVTTQLMVHIVQGDGEFGVDALLPVGLGLCARSEEGQKGRDECLLHGLGWIFFRCGSKLVPKQALSSEGRNGFSL